MAKSMKFSANSKSLLMGGLCSLVLFTICWSAGLTTFIDEQLDLQAQFKVRDMTDNAPQKHEKLKIFSIDDVTVQQLKVDDYSLGTWAHVLEKIADRKPKAIVIDKMFEKTRTATREQVDSFVKRLQALPAPVIIGSSIESTKRVSQSRNSAIRQLRNEYRLENFNTNESKLDLDELKEHTHFGAKNKLQPAFSKVGSIDFTSIASSRIISHIKIEGESRLIAHAGLYPFDLEWSDSDLKVDGMATHTDRYGQTLNNLMDIDSFWDGNFRLLAVFKAMFEKIDLVTVDEGDIVLILPEMYSGNADFKPTYLGEHPGGLLIASVINTALHKKWIWKLQDLQLTLALGLCAMLGFLLSLTLSTRQFVIKSTWIISIAIATGFFLFAKMNLSFPMFSLAFVFLIGGVPLSYIKFRDFEKTSYKIQSALGGAVSEKEVTAILRNPDKLKLEPQNQSLNIVFIDMVGFSLTAESRPALEVFTQLKAIYASIREIVHKYGGYVDRSLGDGLLCYFGFDYGQKNYRKGYGHIAAVECAVALQEYMLQRNIEAYTKGIPIYPLRIGINTDEVCTGDLGDSRKLDFTVIGNGVNFASRLEGACEHYCILIGESTYDLLITEQRDRFGFVEKLIKIKHHDKLLKAYECNPLKNHQDKLDKALKQYADQEGKSRKDSRRDLEEGCLISVNSEYGSGQILNFSANGLAFDLDKYIAKGAMLHITFDSPDGVLAKMCEDENIFPIFAEIRWAHVVRENRILHGVSFVNLTPKQREWLYEKLVNYMQEHRDDSRKRAAS